MQVAIDRSFNASERILTKGAAIPGLGIPLGAAKVALGITQAVIALAMSILTAPLQLTDYKSINDYCWSHVAHGASNILAGLAEAIPGLGTYLYFERYPLTKGEYGPFYTRHEDKFMPYENLVELDFEIQGTFMQNRYNRISQSNFNATPKDKLEFAKQALQDYRNIESKLLQEVQKRWDANPQMSDQETFTIVDTVQKEAEENPNF